MVTNAQQDSALDSMLLNYGVSTGSDDLWDYVTNRELPSDDLDKDAIIKVLRRMEIAANKYASQTYGTDDYPDASQLAREVRDLKKAWNDYSSGKGYWKHGHITVNPTRLRENIDAMQDSLISHPNIKIDEEKRINTQRRIDEVLEEAERRGIQIKDSSAPFVKPITKFYRPPPGPLYHGTSTPWRGESGTIDRPISLTPHIDAAAYYGNDALVYELISDDPIPLVEGTKLYRDRVARASDSNNTSKILDMRRKFNADSVKEALNSGHDVFLLGTPGSTRDITQAGGLRGAVGDEIVVLNPDAIRYTGRVDDIRTGTSGGRLDQSRNDGVIEVLDVDKGQPSGGILGVISDAVTEYKMDQHRQPQGSGLDHSMEYQSVPRTSAYRQRTGRGRINR